MNRYLQPMTQAGEYVTRGQYLHRVGLGVYLPSNGYGRAVKDGKMCPEPVVPNEPRSLPEDATHVIWVPR